ncbi:hypothetical protein PHLGIDRAFT_80257, partial [Phlebiopsis gigantea 11061_1 CR5-6]
ERDDIRVEYHPNSGRRTKVYRFDDYARESPSGPIRDHTQEKPYEPWKSLVDFEFAELVLDKNLKKEQVEFLLSLINRNGSVLSFSSYADIEKGWEKAALYHPKFNKETYTVNYRKQPQSFDIHVRSLWEWIVSVVEEPDLAPHFQWDAQRISKWNGERWVQQWEDPCTGESMWDAQTQLPEKDGKPLGIILYADKSKISSFGTQQGYPVVARIANVDSSIRNGRGMGGGRIVGFLPVVSLKDTPKTRGVTEWVDFKRVVWHEGFKHILESVEILSKVGFVIVCGDKIERKLYPYLHILSADYEEQCVMALIRGNMGKCPCPICEVPDTELLNLRKKWPERNPIEIEKLITQKYKHSSDKEKLLQAKGLRPIISCFWALLNWNVYKALSFDRLHAYHLGLFADHIWDQLKKVINKLPKSAAENVDKGAAAMPRWRKLSHFDKIMLMEFSDGNKFRDIAKICLYAACNVLTKKASPAGYALMKVLRKYLECDTLMGFEVHTEDTLERLDNLIMELGDLIQKYHVLAQALFVKPKDKVKSWNFPKVHTHAHATRDICLKGVLMHMSTRISEGLHGPVRNWVKERTNNQNIWDQVTNGDQKLLCSLAIRERINAWNNHTEELAEDNSANSRVAEQYTFMQISLGSLQPKMTIGHILDIHKADSAFNNFLPNLNTSLTGLMTAEYQTPTIIDFASDTPLIEARFIKVDFESMVTWRQERDYLRCSPMFHHQPRYDGIIFLDAEGLYAFAKLVFVFVCIVPGPGGTEKVKVPMALVQTCEHAIRRHVDHDLGLYPLRMRDRSYCRIIPLRSVVRGALLYKDSDPKRPHHYFAVDIVDSDMFLRVGSIFD